MRAMILAAGLGTRLRPLTELVPKPMVPVANRPVLEHLLRLLRRHGLTEVVVNLHWFPEAPTSYIGDGAWLGMRVEWSYEPTLLGTAGGIGQVGDFLRADAGEPFLVLLGDVLTDVDLTALADRHRQSGALVTMTVREVADPARYGVLTSDGRGRVTSFRSAPPWGPGPWVSNCGVYAFDQSVLDRIPPGVHHLGDQLLPSLFAEGASVLMHSTTAFWSDVGSLDEYRRANFRAIAGDASLELPGRETSPGIRLGEHTWVAESAEVRGPALVGARCRIEADARLIGPVVLGDGCVVESGATVADTIAWDAVLVGSGASVAQAVIARNSQVRPGSRVRGAAIGEGCVVGENSEIGPVRVEPNTVLPPGTRLG